MSVVLRRHGTTRDAEKTRETFATYDAMPLADREALERDFPGRALDRIKDDINNGESEIAIYSIRPETRPPI